MKSAEEWVKEYDILALNSPPVKQAEEDVVRKIQHDAMLEAARIAETFTYFGDNNPRVGNAVAAITTAANKLLEGREQR